MAKKPYVRKPKTTKPKVAKLPLVKKLLDAGIQYKKTLYTGAGNLDTYAGPAQHLYDELVRDIPKYRNDALATNRQGNLHQSRTSDKIFVKGIMIRMTFINFSTVTNCQWRLMLFRNNGWEEGFVPFSNLFKQYDGSNAPPSVYSANLARQRFNHDLVRSKKDIFLDKYFTSGIRGNQNNLTVYNKYIPIDQVADWETKGDGTSAIELKNGRYQLVLCLARDQGSDVNLGICSWGYEIDVIWAQS